MADRRYTKEHEWVEIEDGIAKIGISDFAQKELGDIVFVELPEVGDTANVGDAVATVESVKAASGIYTVVGGEIVAVNDELLDAPEKLNEDAEGTFIFAVKAENVDEGELMSKADYDAMVAKEG